MAATCTSCGEALAADARFCPHCGTAVIAVSKANVDPLVGQIIADRYLVLDRIGQGKSGAIYRAEHTTLHRKIAVKVLHPELSRDDSAVEKFRREATTIGALDNDHVLQVMDFGRTADGRLFFAMELLEGETLDMVIAKDDQLSPARAVGILVQVAEALEQAHESGYIHRDLRPRNVFLSVRRGQADFVKLLDFGLAKLIVPDVDTKQTALGMAFGDARYMAPEQVRGETIDARSDVFALGVVAYEMLTGEVPFAGSSPVDVVQKILDDRPARLREPGCPPWLVAVVDKMLAKAPSQRFDTMGAIIACLRGEVAPAEAPRVAAMPKAVEGPKATLPRIAPASAPLAQAAPASSRATTLPGSTARATALQVAVVPPPDAPDVADRDQTNPGRRPPVREIHPAHDIPADSVSGEVKTIARPERVEAASTPSIVVEDDEMRAEVRDDATAPQKLHAGAVQAPMLSGPVTAPQTPVSISGMQRAVANVTPELVKGEPTGPQRAVGDDGWFSDKGVAPAGDDEFDVPGGRRDRGPVLIGVIAGGIVLVGVAIAGIAMWAKTKDAPHQPPVVVAPAVPVASKPAPPPVAVAVPTPPVVPAPVVEPKPAHVDAPKPAHVDAPKPAHVDAPKPVKPAPPVVAAAKPMPHGFVDPFSGAAAGGDADVFVRTGRQKLAGGDFAQAQSAFSHAREVDPKNADAIAGLGEVSFEQGDYANAAALVRQALRLSPNRARFLILLGQAYYKVGKTKDAVAAYRHALKVDPASQEAQHSLDLAEKKLTAEGGSPN